MLLNTNEKRNFPRIRIKCDVTYRQAGSGIVSKGICHDLSGSGILFIAKDPLTVGARLEISVVPQNKITPPLDAIIEVVRTEPGAQAGQYKIAGAIQQVRSTGL
jgi:hypothetical protein